MTSMLLRASTWLLTVWFVSVLIFCPVPTALAAEKPASFQVWQVLDVSHRKSVPFEDWLQLLAQQDVIYLGEEHRNHWHIEAALKILHALIENHRHPLLAMEMFGWDGQAALNQRVTDANLSRAQFLDASHWQQNWGGAYEDYEPLVSFVSTRHLPLLALNPPRPLVRKVATQGLHSAMNDPDMATWGMKDQQIVEDERYREVILRQLQLCHGGLPASAYERMYEASMFRDEGMAKTIAEALRTASMNSSSTSGPIISYTGGGHIQYQLPIPNRVRRQAEDVKQTSVYMTSFVPDQPEEIEALLNDHIADYLWLTPVGADGPPKRCR
jgi:uncharacterized iron-regulated protein